ncbi:hypothetical protein EDB92DRAFT_2116938 [Lactarius akahatsu]|uniref:Uncharacterized protein n=1 Tax=Lactarius akahatsu TaxID=416441 RepID=A0AAD4LBA3_9AGAM|nr:hypothetical protein EDB92DRAFT_2116938 [Lactarius akahatsu]
MLAGPDASVAFTHISSATAAAFTTALPLASAEEELAPSSSDSDGGAFAWFLFGGIPGDDLPRDRTARSVPNALFGPRADGNGYSPAMTKRIVVDDRVLFDEICRTFHPLGSFLKTLLFCAGSPGDPLQHARECRNALSYMIALRPTKR